MQVTSIYIRLFLCLYIKFRNSTELNVNFSVMKKRRGKIQKKTWKKVTESNYKPKTSRVATLTL